MNVREENPILIVGGTGHYGRHIVHSLQKRGHPVRVLSRSAKRAQEVLGPDVEIVEGDITSRQAVVAALEGARAVVISVSAFSRQQIRRIKAVERDAVLEVLSEAQKGGISRVVYVSVYEIRQDVARDSLPESTQIKADVEAALARSDLNWTVLGAPPSMELFFALIRGATMIVPGGGPPALPTISPVDLGEIAAQAAQRDDLPGKRFRLAGPEILSFQEAAARISKATGRTLSFRSIPLVLPRIARVLLGPLTPLSDTLLFAHQMLGFLEMLTRFPEDIAAGAPAAHRLLRDTFDYTPTTLEMEVHRRRS